MKRIGIAMLALMSAAAAANPADEVRCREIGFSKSIERKDIEAFKTFLDADARFVSNRPRRGVEEISASWSRFTAEDGPSIRWRPRFVEVVQDGTLALSVGVYEAIGKNEDGTETKSYGSFHSTWRLNDDGVWRVVFDAGDYWARGASEEDLALLDAEDDCEE
ncbi:MAG: nuclear transport factor 2 family protein [Woeseiaceae bacterium]|nr:nuclear transport factor 2 family protein [Woeseiaceae bacterium]